MATHVESDHGLSVLDRVIQQMTGKIEAGQAIDLDAYLAEYPELSEQIRRIVPALEAMQMLRDSLGDKGTAAVLPWPAEELRAGLLGDYRIRREIGRGGMGIVYEAEQVSLGRKVALKVLPFAAIMDNRQLARFKNEAHAAACLTHQNIVPVYSVGCERGVHYYAMQYVDGQSLAHVIQHLRSKEGRTAAEAEPDRPGAEEPPSDLPPTEAEGSHPAQLSAADSTTGPLAQLSTDKATNSTEYFRSVARLAIQAAEALDHAHQHGILHRDIKPGNLLLDTAGNLWVTDFGLARFQSEANITMTGDLVGTLRYMSPEQAMGKRAVVDHRADIYSLGVTLYELLTLEPAFAGSDREELLQQIGFEDPRRPRTRDRHIPAELEIIAFKAMEKCPEDRYCTAQELADDLRRFLYDQPIRAQRPSVRERCRKWSRRHKVFLRSAAFILAAVMVFAIVVTRRHLSIQQAVNDALTQATALEPAASVDDRALLMARESIQRAVALVESGLVTPHSALRVHQLSAELDQDQRDRELLKAMEKAYLTSIQTDTRPPSNTELSRASLLGCALEAYRLNEPIALFAQRINNRPKAVQDALLEALYEYAVTPPSVMMAILSDAVDQEIDLDLSSGSTHRLSVPRDSKRIADWAIHRYYADERMTSTIRFPDGSIGIIIPNQPGLWAHKLLETLDTNAWRRLLRQSWLLTDYNEWQTTCTELATAANTDQQPVLLLTRLASQIMPDQRGLRLLEQIQQQRPNDFSTNVCLGQQLLETSPPRFLDAVRYYTAAVALKPQSGILRFKLGLALSKAGLQHEAGIQYRRGLALESDQPIAHFTLASELLCQGLFDQAITELERAVRLIPDKAGLHTHLGCALFSQGKFPEAITSFRNALQLTPASPLAHCNLAVALYASGQTEDAINEFCAAIELCPTYTEAEDKLDLAIFHSASGSDSTVMFSQFPRNCEPVTGTAKTHCAMLPTPAYDLDKAQLPGSHSLPQGLFLQRLVANWLQHFNRGKRWATIGTNYHRKHQWEKAKYAFTVSERFGLNNSSPVAPLGLAMSHWQLGHKEEAKKWYDQAVDWMAKNKPDEELLRFKAEADELLGIKPDKSDLGESAPDSDTKSASGPK